MKRGEGSEIKGEVDRRGKSEISEVMGGLEAKCELEIKLDCWKKRRLKLREKWEGDTHEGKG